VRILKIARIGIHKIFNNINRNLLISKLFEQYR